MRITVDELSFTEKSVHESVQFSNQIRVSKFTFVYILIILTIA